MHGLKQAGERALALVAAIAILVAVVVPGAFPREFQAAAMSFGDGAVVTGDFKGTGHAQIASLFDPNEELSLNIAVLDRAADANTFAETMWFISGPNSFDLARMKVVATDVDFDGKTDIVALYDDGGTSVRILVFRSTGSSFEYRGAWWQSNGYAFSRTKAVLAGNFSAVGHFGLLFVYQYDNFQMRIHYLESDGTKFIYNGNQGVYDSGPGQYDTARAKFVIGRFTRSTGPDQIASFYQYANFRIKIHVFDPTPTGLQPVNGWAGVYDSGEGQYDLSRMKLAKADLEGDGRDDVVSLYGYADGSVRLQEFSGAAELKNNGGAAGIAYLGPGAVSWGTSQLVGGDWDGDKVGDLATLDVRDDGTTHAGMLRSAAARLTWVPDAWVTPAAEIARTTCATECWPLNGNPIAGGPVARRPLLVKIDNHPSARPHYGIGEADMVFEVLVEGYITRLAAVFHSGNPDEIGGIRSGRLADRSLTPMVRGALVYSGATIEETEAFRNDARAGAYYDMDAGIINPSPYYRVDFRPNPYNMFSRSNLLRDALNRLPNGGAPVEVPRWDFLKSAKHSPTAGGFGGAIGASTLTIPYRSNATVRYDYDATTRTYARYQANGAGTMVREVDGHSGAAVAPRNVVIVYTDVWETTIVEDIFNSKGLDMRLLGTGPATIFRDGLRQDGSWGRPGLYDRFSFYTRDGGRIYLAPGQTWIHIVPSSWQIISS